MTRISAGVENDFPLGRVPLESMGNLPSIVRHLPVASYFSRPKPSGSMRLWQDAQMALARCFSSCTRMDPVLTASSSSDGTSAGGGGGGVPRMFWRMYLPRITGEVRVG